MKEKRREFPAIAVAAASAGNGPCGEIGYRFTNESLGVGAAFAGAAVTSGRNRMCSFELGWKFLAVA